MYSEQISCLVVKHWLQSGNGWAWSRSRIEKSSPTFTRIGGLSRPNSWSSCSWDEGWYYSNWETIRARREWAQRRLQPIALAGKWITNDRQQDTLVHHFSRGALLLVHGVKALGRKVSSHRTTNQRYSIRTEEQNLALIAPDQVISLHSCPCQVLLRTHKLCLPILFADERLLRRPSTVKSRCLKRTLELLISWLISLVVK